MVLTGRTERITAVESVDARIYVGFSSPPTSTHKPWWPKEPKGILAKPKRPYYFCQVTPTLVCTNVRVTNPFLFIRSNTLIVFVSNPASERNIAKLDHSFFLGFFSPSCTMCFRQFSQFQKDFPIYRHRIHSAENWILLEKVDILFNYISFHTETNICHSNRKYFRKSLRKINFPHSEPKSCCQAL